MLAGGVDLAVVSEHRLELRFGIAEVEKEVVQVTADVRLEKIEVPRTDDTLDGSAYIQCGVDQGAVKVKQVYGESRNHAGCGRSPPSSPVTRLPPSGRTTCC